MESTPPYGIMLIQRADKPIVRGRDVDSCEETYPFEASP